MEDASKSEADNPISIDWRMSASLEDVVRAGGDYPEVTSLEQAVRAWSALDEQHRSQARLIMDRPITIDGGLVSSFNGGAIETFLKYLPQAEGGLDDEHDSATSLTAGFDQGKP